MNPQVIRHLAMRRPAMRAASLVREMTQAPVAPATQVVPAVRATAAAAAMMRARAQAQAQVIPAVATIRHRSNQARLPKAYMPAR